MAKIVLCGYMGCGKTTIAKHLSVAAGLSYFDLDEVIEKEAGKTTPEIFEQEGEIKFRKLEHIAFKKVLETEGDCILSLGGGTPCYANNHLLLQLPGVTSIYLKTGIQELITRISSQHNTRPLLNGLKGQELQEFVAKHLFDRSYYYHQAKHVVVTDGKTPELIVNQIISLL